MFRLLLKDGEKGVTSIRRASLNPRWVIGSSASKWTVNGVGLNATRSLRAAYIPIIIWAREETVLEYSPQLIGCSR